MVGREEADVKNGDVSFDSPIGKALLGKRVGEESTVRAPRGTRTLEILEVRYV